VIGQQLPENNGLDSHLSKFEERLMPPVEKGINSKVVAVAACA